jgi:hypothetical protein
MGWSRRRGDWSESGKGVSLSGHLNGPGLISDLIGSFLHHSMFGLITDFNGSLNSWIHEY